MGGVARGGVLLREWRRKTLKVRAGARGLPGPLSLPPRVAQARALRSQWGPPPPLAGGDAYAGVEGALPPPPFSSSFSPPV